MSMASLFFEPHPLNLVHIHFFITCMHAIILSLLSQAVSDLAKSVLFVTGGVLALVYKPYVKKGDFETRIHATKVMPWP